MAAVAVLVTPILLAGTESALAAAAAYLIAYAGVIAIATFFTGPRPMAYLTAACFLALIATPFPSASFAAALAAGWLAAIVGYSVSLRHFPWRMPHRSIVWDAYTLPGFVRVAGPYDPPSLWQSGEKAVVVLLSGWAALCVSLNNELPLGTNHVHYSGRWPVPWDEAWGYRYVVPHVALAATALGLMRILFIFWSSHRAPLSPWTRVRTGRFLVPRYDAVFVAPIVAVLVALYLPPLIYPAIPSVSVAVGLSTAAVAACLVLIGPSHRHWTLTAAARLTKANYVVAPDALRRKPTG